MDHIEAKVHDENSLDALPVSRLTFIGRRVEVEDASLQKSASAPSGLSQSMQSRSANEANSAAPIHQEISARPELPAGVWGLLDIYFTYTQCWFPIIERHDILRVLYHHSQQNSEGSSSPHGSGEQAALWAIIAYTSAQRVGMQLPSGDSMAPNANTERLYDHARNLIPSEDEEFELGHVQALLVLVLYNIGHGKWRPAWLLVGLAVRIAIDLDLPGKSHKLLKEPRPDNFKERRKHVFLGCFVLDTLIAARLDRCPHLRRDDVERCGYVNEDGLEELDPWVDYLGVQKGRFANSHGPSLTLSTFNRLIQILQVLNDVTCNTSAGVDGEDMSKNLLQHLRKWNEDQHSKFFLDQNKLLQAPAELHLLPHQYNLHLAHIATLCALHFHSFKTKRAFEDPERKAPEALARLAIQTIRLLRRHSDSLGLLIVPPTFEYFTMLACDSVRMSRSNITDELKQDMYMILLGLGKAWPSFEPLIATFVTQALVKDQMGNAGGWVGSPFTPDSLDVAHCVNPPSANNCITIPFETIPSQRQSLTQVDATTESAVDSGRHQLISPSSTWPSHPSLEQMSIMNEPSSATLVNYHHHTGTISSEIDGDSVFNEFATIDAMQW
jgi:hypothetical protein